MAALVSEWSTPTFILTKEKSGKVKRKLKFAALVVAAAMLCGCSGGQAPPQQEETGIAEVEAAIAAIGQPVSPEIAEEIRLAEELYYALSNEERAQVANADALESALVQLDEMEIDIDTVIDLIDAIGEVKLSKEPIIRQARINYTELDEGLRQYVTNYAKLTEAETAFEALTAQMAAAEMEEPYEYPETDGEAPADKDNGSENIEADAPDEEEPAPGPEGDESVGDFSETMPETNEEYPAFAETATPEMEILKEYVVFIGSQAEMDALDLRDDAKKITSVSVLPYRDISDISPLSSLTNLTALHLDNIDISDISPLSSLTNLTELDLSKNDISDIDPLSSLTSLTTLNLSQNDISDLSPLSSLTNLTELRLLVNNISDISPLSGLTNLTCIDLAGNNISDIGVLSSLTDLTHLCLNSNNISDISPLGNLTDLTELYLADNNISDIGVLSGLTDLTMLYLSDNNISDISPLSRLTNLTWLKMTCSNISDIRPLGSLTGLTTLYLEGSQLTQQQIDELQAMLPDCNIYFD